MFCVGRPSMFRAMPLFVIDPSISRGLIHDALGNGTGFRDLLSGNQPNCGHSNPVDLLEQLIIEDTIRDVNQMCKANSDHQYRKEGLVGHNSKKCIPNIKGNNIAKHEEMTNSLANDRVTNQSNLSPGDSNCGKNVSESNESQNSVLEKEEIYGNNHVDVIKSTSNDDLAKQSKPWSVTIDMNGCDEVRARTEENKIVVEGHTQNSEGFMAIKRVMTLPRNVKSEALTATLGTNGTLTLTETKARKENKASDISVSKENTVQISKTDQSMNQSDEDDCVQIENTDINLDDSNL